MTLYDRFIHSASDVRRDAGKGIAAKNVADALDEIGGWTGRRVLTASLSAGWTADRVIVSRDGHLVCLEWRNLDYSTGGTSTVYTLPVGFRPVNPVIAPTLVDPNAGASTTNGTMQVQSTGAIIFDITGDNYDGIVVYPTIDAWPTSLPGTAA